MYEDLKVICKRLDIGTHQQPITTETAWDLHSTASVQQKLQHLLNIV